MSKLDAPRGGYLIAGATPGFGFRVVVKAETWTGAELIRDALSSTEQGAESTRDAYAVIDSLILSGY